MIGTNNVTLNNTSWTNLGNGPLQIEVLSETTISLIVSDTMPTSLTITGMQASNRSGPVVISNTTTVWGLLVTTYLPSSTGEISVTNLPLTPITSTNQNSVTTVLNNVTTLTTNIFSTLSPLVYPSNYRFQALVTGTGTVTATVVISGTDIAVGGVPTGWVPLATINLSGTTSNAGSIGGNVTWRYIQIALTAISGTGATVIATVGF